MTEAEKLPEKGGNPVGSSKKLEVVLENETADFEQDFGDIGSNWRNWSPVEYLEQKQVNPAIYGFAGVGLQQTAVFSSLTVMYALGIQSVPALAGIGGFFGNLILAPWISSASIKLGEKINNRNSDFNDKFEGEFYCLDSFESVESFLANSDEVKYDLSVENSFQTHDPAPEDVAEDYQQMIEVLETESRYWRTEKRAVLEEKLSQDERELLESYEPEEDESDLVDIEDLEETVEAREETLEAIEQKIEETEINQYIRFKEVEKPAYTGFAYKLEVYQGEELRFSVLGLSGEKASEEEQEKVDVLEPVHS